MAMTETSTVMSKSMVNIPAPIRKKYGIKEGDKIASVETEEGLTIVRIPPLAEIYGSGREHHDVLSRAPS